MASKTNRHYRVLGILLSLLSIAALPAFARGHKTATSPATGSTTAARPASASASVAPSTPANAAGPKTTAAGGKLWYLEISTSLVRPRTHRHPARQVIVYTPAGYDAPAHAGDRYPVLYLLHGSPGDPTDFIEYGDFPGLSEKASRETGGVAPILVIPDGNYSGEKHGDSEWANSADGRDLFEDFIVRELIAWTDKRFRTITAPAGRMIGGVSEGGYGCVNLALHHPDVFGGVIALSGYFDNGGYGWARKVLGYDEDYLHANSPLAYLSTGLPSGKGPSDWRSIRFFLGVGANEKRYTAETVRLAEKLKSIGAPTTLQMLEGKHGWELWDQLYYLGIKSMLQANAPVASER